MPKGRVVPSVWLWTVAATAGLAWGVFAIVFAAVGPSGAVPHVFYSYHIEHFVAFYVVTVLAAAGLPRTRLLQVAFSMAVMAAVLALIRMWIPRHHLSGAEDFVADVAGILAAVLPILVGHFRRIAAESLPGPA